MELTRKRNFITRFRIKPDIWNDLQTLVYRSERASGTDQNAKAVPGIHLRRFIN